MIRAHAGKGEYGMLNKHRYRLDSAPFSLALFVLMLGCVLILAVFGAQVYRALTETQSRNNAVRASLSYVAACLLAADEDRAVSVKPGPQGDALILADAGQDTGYETRIYVYDGQLMEEYAEKQSDFDPASAQAVARTDTFTVMVDGPLVSVTTDQGTVRVYLHAGEAEE